MALKHRFQQIHQAVARRLLAAKRSAPGDGLAGQHALIAPGQALVLPKEVTDLPGACADIARRHVGVRADVAVQLRHHALAKAHDLAVAFAFGVKIAAALAAADGQAGQAVFQHLLHPQELDNAQVNAGVQAQAALIRAQRA